MINVYFFLIFFRFHFFKTLSNGFKSSSVFHSNNIFTLPVYTILRTLYKIIWILSTGENSFNLVLHKGYFWPYHDQLDVWIPSSQGLVVYRSQIYCLVVLSVLLYRFLQCIHRKFHEFQVGLLASSDHSFQYTFWKSKHGL